MTARDLIYRIISNPRVFQIQTTLLRGHRLNDALLPVARRATSGRTEGKVIDVGGGTASARSLWPDSWTYISIDSDPRLVTFSNTDDAMRKFVGDASRLALRDDSVDIVLMKNVSHHLDNEKWLKALSEAERVLSPDGRFIFLDAVRTPRRPISRLAWSLDAGRFPRISTSIENAIAAHFEIDELERMTFLHHCILLTGRPRKAHAARVPDQSVT
jgi:SAM-dependent methyltransferase